MFHHRPVRDPRHAFENRRQGVELSRGAFHAHEQFARGHQRRLKDDVFLAVILGPIAGQDSALAIEPPEQWGVGKCSHEALQIAAKVGAWRARVIC
jgi:hypothetical protein